MKILLVFPRIEHGATTYSDKGSWSSILFGYPIITLPHLAGITPRQHTVKIVNENYEELDYNEQADLIGITSYTMTAPRVYEIADEFRRRGKKVVLGGYHPTAMPQEAIQHADSVVLGEAELTWPELIHDMEKGVLKQFYGPNPDFDMAAIPPIRRDLIRQNPLIGAVQSTRGCPNQCEFCAIASFCKHEVKQRPVKNVVDEIMQMPNRIFVIHDPSLTVNPSYSRELFKELIRQKVHKGWVSNGNSNVLGKIDDEFLNLAKKSGCVEWFVGFESVSQDSLNGIKKTVNKVEDFKKTIKRLHKHGMAVQGGIIFGFDQDTPDIFDLTLEKMYEWELDAVEINILTPFPGTPLYDRLESEGRIISKDWKRYNQVDVVFKPKHMTEKELFEGTCKVAKEFYNVPNVIHRALRTFAIVRNLSSVLPAGTNYTFRRYYKRDFHF
ncbi:MAG TPA: B12-binding domain-containing radical SAM protein [Thermoplasmata archaeon]|nr:B12-binding domain-containing radical SAM protein [Thermoplasmata archaeon]